MNLDACTPAQRESIRHLDGPLFIAAGAGSGKTFTLQQRIAYALLPESGPACSSIDEVLAITFMEKAAGEVKSRVRGALRAEGMADEALKVDGAWISTIHGMCSRILRENALEAGIDPDFQMLSELQERRLRGEALERVLSRERGEDRFAGLFREYGAGKGSSGPGGGVSVQGMLKGLLEKASSFADGLDAVDVGPGPVAPKAAARTLLDAYADGLQLVEAVMGAKPTATQQKTRALCADAAARLERYILDGADDYGGLLEAMRGLDAPRRDGFGKKQAGEAGSEAAERIASALGWAYDCADAAAAWPLVPDLLELARRVEGEYQLMLDERGVLGNNELLHRALRLLQARPDIAAGYRRRFKLVMVDEFQDTNQLQVDLISLVAGTDRLCTVGDAQQSIYRFNGADVAVFDRRRDLVRGDGSGRALIARLDDNFRSHGDVLAFVRRVCGQEQVFGDEFLDLRASRAERGRYKGTGPRVEVQLCTYEGKKETSGVLRAQAEGIAARFSELRAAGHGAGEMVVLLSGMTQADVYAQALRDRGFSCVLGGGRSFYAAEEVRTLADALSALANPEDAQALFSVLAGELFRLSADDLLALGTVDAGEDGFARARALGRGVRDARAAGEGASPALAFAVEVLDRALRRTALEPPSRVLRALFAESGWLSRLEAQGVEGTARAANVLKALRAIEDLEKGPGMGISSVARDFRAMMDEEADGPGSLSVSDQNAVRIMTIHKSKGLEFPIVAVVCCEPQSTRAGAFLCDAVAGRPRLALTAKRSRAERPPRAKSQDAGACPIEEAKDAVSFEAALRQGAGEEELAEARRKFYVACTRSSEYLLVCGLMKPTKDPLGGYRAAPVLDDVRAALMGDEDFPPDEARLDYGGSEPLLFTRRHCAADDAADETAAAPARADVPVCPPAEMEVPVLPECVRLTCVPVNGNAREGLFSYTSLSRDHSAGVFQSEAASGEEPVHAAADAAPETDAPAPSATDLGDAFHRVAQLAVLRRGAEGRLCLPPPARVEAIAARHGCAGGAARGRLDAALARWFDSEPCARADAHEVVRAEVPFMAHIECGGEPRLLEGEIDLLACDRAATRAFVVDYKTGGSDAETPAQLHEKHRLQATCYAYALLLQGFSEVEFAFVRVERPDPDDPAKPQVVPYRFEAADLPRVRAAIQKAHEAAMGNSAGTSRP